LVTKFFLIFWVGDLTNYSWQLRLKNTSLGPSGTLLQGFRIRLGRQNPLEVSQKKGYRKIFSGRLHFTFWIENLLFFCGNPLESLKRRGESIPYLVVEVLKGLALKFW